jgi:hypothetical protein
MIVMAAGRTRARSFLEPEEQVRAGVLLVSRRVGLASGKNALAERPIAAMCGKTIGRMCVFWVKIGDEPVFRSAGVEQ